MELIHIGTEFDETLLLSEGIEVIVQLEWSRKVPRYSIMDIIIVLEVLLKELYKKMMEESGNLKIMMNFPWKY